MLLFLVLVARATTYPKSLMTITINEPVSIYGYVVDAALVSPDNTVMTNERDQYSVVLELEDPEQIEDFEIEFKDHDHNSLPTTSDWCFDRGMCRIHAKSVIAPRLEGIKGEPASATRVLLRCKPVVKELDEAIIHTIQIVYVQAAPLADEFEEAEGVQYEF